ncbi:MAG: hypothetical protein WD066_10125 [Planctomycetaceae bacterium]
MHTRRNSALMIVAAVLAFAAEMLPASAQGPAGNQANGPRSFSRNPQLADIPDLAARVVSEGYERDGGVLAFSGFFHYFDPAAKRWHKLEPKIDDALDNKNIRHRHVYDPVDNVHLVIAGGWKTFALKLSDKPGRLPGVGENRLPAAR